MINIKFNNRKFIINSCDTYKPTKITEYILVIIKYLIKTYNNISSLLEVGGGSGALSISIEKTFKKLSITVLEPQKTVYNNLITNIKKHNSHIQAINSKYELFNDYKFDVIVSNPPYIKSQDLQNYSKAINTINIDGGVHGMNLINKILESKAKFIILEIGYIDQVKNILTNKNWKVMLMSRPKQRYNVYFCLLKHISISEKVIKNQYI